MARESKAAVQPVTVNPEKIVRGLTTVFQGFSVMFDGMAEQMQLMQDMTDQFNFPGAASPVSAPKEAVKAEDAAEADEEFQTEETMGTDESSQASDSVKAEGAPQDADTPPWKASQKEDDSKQDDSEQEDSKPDTSSTSKPAMTITQADLTQVIVAKIKLNRSNNGKIGELLGSYGVSLLSDLPAEKYEAFLNDLSQL